MRAKRCLQYSLKRMVPMRSRMVNPVDIGAFLMVNTPSAMICVSTSENTMVLCMIGHSFPPISYLG